VLTHFSQRYPEVEPFVEEAKAIFPHVVAARDGETIAVPKRQR
jgi:ribonuclease BN (tRNA processing enzyme)